MLKSLPGFQDFFPEEYAKRDYIIQCWKNTIKQYGFIEYESPTLEFSELYKKEGGEEIITQLYDFTDKGGRNIALRPEITPSLVRMILMKNHHYRKPLRWFTMAKCFRYERQQKGRFREFLQLNCDIVGDKSHAADAEIIALLIHILLAFGFAEESFVIRISDRRIWDLFFKQNSLDPEKTSEFLSILDKKEKMNHDMIDQKLQEVGSSLENVNKFIGNIDESTAYLKDYHLLKNELEIRNFDKYIELDLNLVRGLSYYTGVVFEAYSKKGQFRAIAGGGRYDRLFSHLSDQKTHLPAIGFGMGDAVLSELIFSDSSMSNKAHDKIKSAEEIDAFFILAADKNLENIPSRQSYSGEFDVVKYDGLPSMSFRKEPVSSSIKEEMIALAQALKMKGWRIVFSLNEEDIGKQFQMAALFGSHYAMIFGREWPKITIKSLKCTDSVESIILHYHSKDRKQTEKLRDTILVHSTQKIAQFLADKLHHRKHLIEK